MFCRHHSSDLLVGRSVMAGLLLVGLPPLEMPTLPLMFWTKVEVYP